MQPSHNILDNIIAGAGLSTFSVANIALHRRHSFRYRLLVWITSLLCLVRAGLSFAEAWTLYHSGKSIASPIMYLVGALIVLFLSIQVFSSSGAIIASLQDRHTEQAKEQSLLTMNAQSLEKSERLVSQQQQQGGPVTW